MDLLEVVNLFVAAKQGELVKDTTVESYQRHLNKFIASLPPERAKLNSVLASDVSGFLAIETVRQLGSVVGSD
jgi:site-specific recombinase XerD